MPRTAAPIAVVGDTTSAQTGLEIGFYGALSLIFLWEHWLDVFKTYYGPMFKAFGALEGEKQKALAADLLALAGEFNRATDGCMTVRSEYLEIVVTKQ